MSSRDKIETHGKARLHGVEMPKQLDFTSKKLYDEYIRFKTLTKKILSCYEGLEEKYQVDKVLMWMGPEACVKHANHPFDGDDVEKMAPLWLFFDGICAKKEGTEGSWNASRMKLKFVKQQADETVDQFYDRIRELLQQCEYPDDISRIMETEALKYGFKDVKILEKVYALPKTATSTQVLETARAAEAAQRHLREVDKVRQEIMQCSDSTCKHNTDELRRTRTRQINCTKCGHTHPPKRCPAFGKKCNRCKQINHFERCCRAFNCEAGNRTAKKTCETTA